MRKNFKIEKQFYTQRHMLQLYPIQTKNYCNWIFFLSKSSSGDFIAC